MTSFDGYSAGGGWINHNYEQLGWQLASAVSAMAYAAVVTYILLFIVDHIPGLSLRCSEDDEIIGLDEAHIGEHGYDFVRFISLASASSPSPAFPSHYPAPSAKIPHRGQRYRHQLCTDSCLGFAQVSIRREIDDTDDSHTGLSRTPSHLSNEKQGAHLPASDALAPSPTAAPRADNAV